MNQAELCFSAPSFSAADQRRLGKQLLLVKGCVVNAGWMTLSYISALTGAPEASVSARLRDLRKLGFDVEVKRATEAGGLHQYRVSGSGVAA